MSEEYLQGDGGSVDPPGPGSFWRGGVAWFYGTAGSFDDACTNADTLKHNYWRWQSGEIIFTGSNGCGGGEFWVREW
jgi:hypothetical protein